MKFYNVFSGFLVGSTREAYLKNIGDRKFNSLHSYWYLMNLSDEKIMDGFSMTKGNIMIDSGAYTAWTKDINLDVDSYINWINKWNKYVTTFGQVDVIPPKKATRQEIDDCCKKTWNNYLYMKDRMISPEKLLYTFHYGEDFKWLKQALEYRDSNGNPIEYMAIGGLVGRSSKQRTNFLDRCFEIIKHSSNSNIKVHGFGVSSEKLWNKYPFESCDSFSPGMKANYEVAKEDPHMIVEGFERIFKVRKDEVNNSEEDMTEFETADQTAEIRAKTLIKNIEHLDNLANGIKR